MHRWMHSWVWATGVLLAFAAPASANVNVFATIDKDKDIFVFENITITKDINVTAVVNSVPTSVAEASAIINQDNIKNRACENCAEKLDTLENSITSNSGIVVSNQSAGNNNNQGSSIAVAVDLGGGGAPPTTPGDDYSFANAQASVEQQNGEPVPNPLNGTPMSLDTVENCCRLGNDVFAVNLVFRTALITGSINSNTGVVHFNQATGSNNNQANALAMAVGLRPDGGVAIAEADLGQFNTCNTVLESNDAFGDDVSVGINKSATITGSVNDNTGVIGVNQTVGNMANQANVVAIAAATTP